MKSFLHISFISIILSLFAGSTLTASDFQDGKIFPTVAEQAPVIDGILNDQTWQAQPFSYDFITYNPTRGETLPYNTDIWIAYDRSNIYIAFRCYDDDPGRIKTSVTQRDNMFADDWIGISLDALGNKQSSYDLFVNPNGIQGDILTSAVSGEDVSPDFVWESAGKVTDSGYDIEMRIPLRSIRFKSGRNVAMGILFWRRISRLGTSGSWPEIPAEQGVFIAHAPIIFQNLHAPLMLEVLPSITYGGSSDRENDTRWSRYDSKADFGVGVKYGLTSSVTAEATYNPDFSQVESDAFQAEVNQRYPVFYSEKRPFFMEGMDIFNFSIIGHGSMLTAVHTRQIVDPLWAGKLTGTIGKAAFGVLAAGDEFPGYAWEKDENPDEGEKANFLVARSKYSFGRDNYAGAIFSGREFAGESNYVYGGDTQFRFLKNHRAAVSMLQSQSTDSEGTGSSGTGINASYSYNSRTWEFDAAYQHYDRDFEMATAFLQRTGIDGGWIYAGYNFYPNPEKFYWLRRISPEFVYAHTYDHLTKLHDRYWYLGTNVSFTRQGNLHLEYSFDQENWEMARFDKHWGQVAGGVQLFKWLGLEGSVSGGNRIFYYGDPAYLGQTLSGSFGFTLQPNEKFNQSFGGYSQTFYRDSDGAYIYNLNILNSRTTYQFNKYFFIRAIIQYNSYTDDLLTDILASFTLIPGTVVHLGYGSLYDRRAWQTDQWEMGRGYLTEHHRGFFFKASYLWQAK